jgi:hypothetical protein
MKRLSLLTLIFAILSLTFFLLLVFLRIPFPLYPLMSIQDAIDIFTSLVLISIYWLMFKNIRQTQASLGSEIFFMVMSAFWAAGQGMHLSANSINNLIGNLAKNLVVDVTATDLYHLTYFYDEYLSHYLWHIGVVGLAVLLIYNAWRYPSSEKTDWRLVAPAGLIYGFTCFCFFLEGNTLIVGLPFVTIVAFLVLLRGRAKLVQQPVLAFFFVSCLFAFLLFIGWRLYWGSFIPIMEVFPF